MQVQALALGQSLGQSDTGTATTPPSRARPRPQRLGQPCWTGRPLQVQVLLSGDQPAWCCWVVWDDDECDGLIAAAPLRAWPVRPPVETRPAAEPSAQPAPATACSFSAQRVWAITRIEARIAARCAGPLKTAKAYRCSTTSPVPNTSRTTTISIRPARFRHHPQARWPARGHAGDVPQQPQARRRLPSPMWAWRWPRSWLASIIFSATTAPPRHAQPGRRRTPANRRKVGDRKWLREREFV